MSFLFGDLKPSPFTTNVLEVVRDTVDFASVVAAADQEIVNAGPRIEALRATSAAELARLEALARAMLAAAASANKGADTSPTAALASELATLVSERHQVAARTVNAQLAADVRQVEAQADAARGRYRAALEAFLLRREPLDATWALRLVLVAKGKDQKIYEAEITGSSDVGLAWTVAVAIPEGSPWAKALRVDQLASGLAILTPQKSGLIKKEVKLKKQKLDRYFVTKLVDDGATVRAELRPELGEVEGIDVAADLTERLVTAERTGEADDVTVGPFAVDPEDKDALLELATKLRAIARALPRKSLVSATFDDAPFDGADAEVQPRLVEIVSRLVAKLAPVVSEIASKSRSDEELVLRRVLDDGRREEIFLARATLRDKLAGLEPAHLELFAPLGLDATPVREPLPSAAEAPASLRSEVPAADPDPGPTLEIVPSDPPTAHAPSEPPALDNDALLAALEHIREMASTGLLGEAYRQYATLFGSTTFTSCAPEDQRKALGLMIRAQATPGTDEAREAHRAAIGALQALVLEHRDPNDYELLGMAYEVVEEPAKASEVFKKALEIERARDPASELCTKLMRRVSA